MIPIGDDNSQRRRLPLVTWTLVGINGLVFLLELSRGEPFITLWSFIPLRFLADPLGNVITLFTSMFMHAGWLHLLGNMLYLIIFGDNVEDRFGHFKFLIFYLLCGVLAMLTQTFFAPATTIPNLGASGAIAGVLGAYLVLFPGRRVRILVLAWIVNMPALVVIGGWILLQFLNSTASTASGGGVAYMAHIGGFISGLLLTFLFRGRQRTLPPPYWSA